MAVAGIISTQMLNKFFIEEPIDSDQTNLKNYRLIDHTNLV
jgi:hypothetical protein